MSLVCLGLGNDADALIPQYCFLFWLFDFSHTFSSHNLL